MANGIRIDNLNSATSLNDTDVMTIVQDKENKKLSMSLIDHDGSYSQSVINTIPDSITTSKSNVETIKQTIDEKFGEDEFSAQINTVKEMSSIGVSDDDSVNVSSQVQDGFMETAILYGKTLVNNVTANTSQDDYVAFDQDYNGQNFSISGTVEGSIKSAILKGQTLFNISTQKSSNTFTFQSAYNGATPNRQVMAVDPANGSTLTKPSTRYIIKFTVSNYINNYGGSVPITILDYDIHSVVKTVQVNGNGNYYIIGTTKETLGYKGRILIKSNTTLFENNTQTEVSLTISNIMVLKYQEGMENWDIPYFEGMQSVKLPVLTTVGKNLFAPKFKNPNIYIDRRPYYSTPINLIEGKKYKMSFDVNGDISKCYFTLSSNPQPTEIGANYLHIINNGKINDGYYVAKKTNYLCFYKDVGDRFSALSNLLLSLNNIQLEEGTTATPYEPYKSNILTVNEPVELRGIGNVQDTLDCLTGEVTQYFDEVTFDGSDDENFVYLQEHSNNDIALFEYQNYFDFNISALKRDGNMMCDKFSINPQYLNPTKEGVYCQFKHINVMIEKSKLSELTTLGIQTYLKQNPIKMILPKQKSIKTVDLLIVDQYDNTINNIHTFNETTHIDTSSQGLIPEISISKSVSYDALIKPSTQYTIDLKHNDKNMTVNVGGSEVVFASGETRKTITTPSTLTNNTLSYYGLGSKANSIMLLEGNETRDLDYFTGMKSVKYTTHEDGSKMPILRTTNGQPEFLEDGITPNPEYKTSILSTENDLIMRSNGSTRDSLDLIIGKFTQRIDEDGNILDTPIETTIDINSNLGDEKLPIVYKGGHILLQSDELTPELQYSIPISYSGLIAQNTMTNLRHLWRLDELELLAYASIVNSQYDSLILVSTAETNDIMVSSDYVPDVSLYNMLKVLVNANALQNADEKISTFYLYGKLSDEMFIDLIMGDDM